MNVDSPRKTALVVIGEDGLLVKAFYYDGDKSHSNIQAMDDAKQCASDAGSREDGVRLRWVTGAEANRLKALRDAAVDKVKPTHCEIVRAQVDELFKRHVEQYRLFFAGAICAQE